MNFFLSSDFAWIIYNFSIVAMILMFSMAVFARIMMFIAVKCEWKFVVEFEHRVEKFLIDEHKDNALDFHSTAKELLNKTHYEFYELKAQRRLRRFDYSVSIFERKFGILKAAEKVIEDTLKQVLYIKNQKDPDFSRIARYVFGNSPYYNKLMGFFTRNIMDDLLKFFPIMLIVCGILGTFVSLMAGLPEIGLVNNANLENNFLNDFINMVTWAMTTTILGLCLSLLMRLFNIFFAPDGILVDIIEIYKNSLSFIWEECYSKEPTKKSETDDLAS